MNPLELIAVVVGIPALGLIAALVLHAVLSGEGGRHRPLPPDEAHDRVDPDVLARLETTISFDPRRLP